MLSRVPKRYLTEPVEVKHTEMFFAPTSQEKTILSSYSQRFFPNAGRQMINETIKKVTDFTIRSFAFTLSLVIL
ncbi:hypothetical protein CWC24_00220 [Pseudoalteromonas ruthenica]|nr:hypothetical protein CWC24_00220 [Pseudoalteromonas ruthenica]TMO50560.1 hypothetical protein CWC23_10700 [Pseudoalteromonas ruthenica]